MPVVRPGTVVLNGTTTESAPLPKGFEAAAPVKNKKRAGFLSGPDITTSGGTHTVAEGHPLLRRQTVQR
jgi:hypothetical protein